MEEEVLAAFAEKGCSRRRRWRIGELLQRGRLFHAPRPTRSYPSSPFTSEAFLGMEPHMDLFR